MRGVMKVGCHASQQRSHSVSQSAQSALSVMMCTRNEASIGAGYIGLGAYFDGQNDGGLRLRQSQPVVMRFTPTVCLRAQDGTCLDLCMCIGIPSLVPNSG